jgi:hypothetical protein
LSFCPSSGARQSAISLDCVTHFRGALAALRPVCQAPWPGRGARALPGSV